MFLSRQCAPLHAPNDVFGEIDFNGIWRWVVQDKACLFHGPVQDNTCLCLNDSARDDLDSLLLAYTTIRILADIDFRILGVIDSLNDASVDSGVPDNTLLDSLITLLLCLIVVDNLSRSALLWCFLSRRG